MIETRRKEAERRVSEDPNRDATLARLEHRAAVQVKKKQFDKAIRTLGEALAIHQATLEKLQKKKIRDAVVEAASHQEAQAIVRLLTSCSKVFLAKGDKENALRAKQDALQLHRRTPPTKTAS